MPNLSPSHPLRHSACTSPSQAESPQYYSSAATVLQQSPSYSSQQPPLIRSTRHLQCSLTSVEAMGFLHFGKPYLKKSPPEQSRALSDVHYLISQKLHINIGQKWIYIQKKNQGKIVNQCLLDDMSL